MKFKLLGIRNGERFSVEFDNIENTFKTKNEIIKIPKRLITKEKNYLVNIKLSSRCNLRCNYCTNKFDNDHDLPNNLIDEAINFVLENKNNIKEVIFNKMEPFVTYDKMIFIIRELRRNGFDKKITTITNGTYLNKTNIKELIDNDIFVTISYDGLNSDRNCNLFENDEICQCVGDLFRYKLNFIWYTISNKSERIEKVISYLREKLKIDNVEKHISYSSIVRYSKNNKIIDFSKQRKNEIQEDIKLFFTKYNPQRLDKLVRFYQDTTPFNLNEKLNSRDIVVCNENNNLKIISNDKKDYDFEFIENNCLNCQYCGICFKNNLKFIKKKNCENYKLVSNIIFKLIFKRLFDGDLIDIQKLL